jgi:RHS repeat-associated protein
MTPRALCAPPGAAQPLDLRAHTPDGDTQIAHDLVPLEAQHLIPRAIERPIAPRIGAPPRFVIPAIDLDDELDRGRVEVGDEPPHEWNLSAERDAELPAAKCLEEPRFGRRGRAAHLCGASFENVESMGRRTHETLRGPPTRPGRARRGRLSGDLGVLARAANRERHTLCLPLTRAACARRSRLGPLLPGAGEHGFGGGKHAEGVRVGASPYDWDEVGQLARARRWDFNYASGVQSYPYPSLPPQTANVDLSYSYDGGGSRVLKVQTSADGSLSTRAEIFPTLRLDNTTFDQSVGDYVRNETTESVYLGSPVGTLGRVVYDPSLPSAAGALHVFLEIGDHLGSATTVIDKDSSELVERITYQAYGATESDYRPTRWASYRETYRFTGKEDDADVGLTYFGARYYSPAMGRWISADPLAIHSLGADINPYRYVGNSPFAHVDPFGLDYGDGGTDDDDDDSTSGVTVTPPGPMVGQGGDSGCEGSCGDEDDSTSLSLGGGSGNDGLGTMVLPAMGGAAPGASGSGGGGGENPNAFLYPGDSCDPDNEDMGPLPSDFGYGVDAVRSALAWIDERDAQANAVADAECAAGHGMCEGSPYLQGGPAGLERGVFDAAAFVYQGFNPVRVPEPGDVQPQSNGAWFSFSYLTVGIATVVLTRGRAANAVEGIALREGESAAGELQGHHIFPRQMAGQFEAGGINIEEFRVQLAEGTHIDQLHGAGDIPGVGPGGVWNETWRQYFAGEAAAGRAITRQGLLEQAGQMLGDFNVPYYSPLPGL